MDGLIKRSPADDAVYAFMDKKRTQGKPYYVYMTAGANNFLRIYYGQVKEYLSTLAEAENFSLLRHSPVFLSAVDSKTCKGSGQAQNENRHNRIAHTHTKHMKHFKSPEHFLYQCDIRQSKVNQRLKPLIDSITHCRQTYVNKQNGKAYPHRAHLAFHSR